VQIQLEALVNEQRAQILHCLQQHLLCAIALIAYFTHYSLERLLHRVKVVILVDPLVQRSHDLVDIA